MSILKVIKEGEAQARRWDAPHVEGDVADSGTSPLGLLRNLLTADQLARIQDHAFKEAQEQGYAQGYKEGVEKAQRDSASKLAEIEQHAKHFAALIQTLSQPFEQLDEEVAQELFAMSVTVARLIIRRELKTDPGQIVAVVREAVAALPSVTRNLQIFLHPEDAHLIRQIFSLNGDQPHWRLIDDPALTRGDCRITTETSHIDATIENRLAAIIAQALGGERDRDAKSP